MNKILGSFILFITFLSAGSITATVDTAEVLKGDSVMLTLTVTGKDASEIPNIEEINGQKVFNIQRRMSSNFVHVNGVSSMEKTQMLMLEFRPDANMTIPSFSVKVDGKVAGSKPIKVTVMKLSKGMKHENKDFALDMKLEKTKFHLGESIVLNLYFKQRSNLDVLQIDYTPPAFKAFFSKQIGEGKTYKKGAYTIQELSYLLTAKKDGNLTLEPARAKIAQRSRQAQRGGWFVDVPKWTTISSSSLDVEVIKPLGKYDIVGKFKLTDKIDVIKVKANKPVTLRLELLGEGNLEEYNGIKFDIPSVTIYSDDAKVQSTLMGQKLQSRYQKSFVFISDHSFIIPSKEIYVYDYETGKIKVLKTKAYNIEVEGGKKVSVSSSVHAATPIDISTPKKKNLSSWNASLPGLLALIFAFVLGVLVTLSLKYVPNFVLPIWKKKRKGFNGEDALRVLYPKIGESKEVEEMVRKLYAVKSGQKGVEIDREMLKVMIERYR